MLQRLLEALAALQGSGTFWAFQWPRATLEAASKVLQELGALRAHLPLELHFDGCMYGQVFHDLPVLQQWAVLTNLPTLESALSMPCNGLHIHAGARAG